MVMPRFDYLLSQLDVLQAESIHVMPRGRGRVRVAQAAAQTPWTWSGSWLSPPSKSASATSRHRFEWAHQVGPTCHNPNPPVLVEGPEITICHR